MTSGLAVATTTMKLQLAVGALVLLAAAPPAAGSWRWQNGATDPRLARHRREQRAPRPATAAMHTCMGCCSQPSGMNADLDFIAKQGGTFSGRAHDPFPAALKNDDQDDIPRKSGGRPLARRRQAQETSHLDPATQAVFCQEIRRAGDCARYSQMCPETCSRAAADNATASGPDQDAASAHTHAEVCAELASRGLDARVCSLCPEACSAWANSEPSALPITTSCATLIELEGGCAHDLSLHDLAVAHGTRVSEVCPAECSGHAGCSEVAVDVSFLGEADDRSGHTVVLRDGACLDEGGVLLSRNEGGAVELGVGNDYVGPGGSFTLSLWLLKSAVSELWRPGDASMTADLCFTAEDGDACHSAVTWAMTFGIQSNPEWYDGLSASSTFAEFQCSLVAMWSNSDCSLPPCGVVCRGSEKAAPDHRKAAPDREFLFFHPAAEYGGAQVQFYAERTEWLDHYDLIVDLGLRLLPVFQVSLHIDEVPRWTQLTLTVDSETVKLFADGTELNRTGHKTNTACSQSLVSSGDSAGAIFESGLNGGLVGGGTIAAWTPAPATSAADLGGVETTDLAYIVPGLGSRSITLDANLADWGFAPFLAQTPFRRTDDATGSGPWCEFEEYGGGIWNGIEDHAMAFALTWNTHALYLGIKVIDDTHDNDGNSVTKGWNGDSVQVAFTDAGRSGALTRYNFGFQTSHNTVVHDSAPSDCPDPNLCTQAAMQRIDVSATTTYEIVFWTFALGVDSFSTDYAFGFGLCVNDGDTDVAGQSGQKGWSGWGPYSIIFSQGVERPEATGLVTLAPAGLCSCDFRGTGLAFTAVLGAGLDGADTLSGTVAMFQLYPVALDLAKVACVFNGGKQLVQSGMMAMETDSSCRSAAATGCTGWAASNGPQTLRSNAGATTYDDGSCVFSVAASAPETGIVHISDAWQTIELNGEYSKPVVICGPLTRSSTTQAIVRVRPMQMGASGTWSFAVRAEQKKCHKIEPPLLAERVSYLVVEAGEDLTGGWQAGKVRVADKEWHRASLHRPIRDPVVLSTVQNHEERTALVTVRQYVTSGDLHSSFFFAADCEGSWCENPHFNPLTPLMFISCCAGAPMANTLQCVAYSFSCNILSIKRYELFFTILFFNAFLRSTLITWLWRAARQQHDARPIDPTGERCFQLSHRSWRSFFATKILLKHVWQALARRNT